MLYIYFIYNPKHFTCISYDVGNIEIILPFSYKTWSSYPVSNLFERQYPVSNEAVSTFRGRENSAKFASD